MTPRTGMILRLVGLFLEVSCASVMMKVRGDGRMFLGIPAETLLICGFGLGFILWALSRTLVKRPKLKFRDPEF